MHRLYSAETPVEGDDWFMNNDYDHRDAAFEEILHLVHDNGIGIDKPGYAEGALPSYQAQIRNATTHNQPTWLDPPGNGFWGEDQYDWIIELQDEGSLTQEYLASVVDVYYGLWGNYGAGMWGIYEASTRGELGTGDPPGYALMPQFFHPQLTWMVMLAPTLNETFRMTFDPSIGYTWKSQYYLHATLLGSNDANLVGNAENNCFGPNAGTNEIDGGSSSGVDVCMFQGNCTEYSITCSASDACHIVDSVNNRDGVTYTSNIDALTFFDGDFDVAMTSCAPRFTDATVKCWSLVGRTLEATPASSKPSSMPTLSSVSKPSSMPTLYPVSKPSSMPTLSPVSKPSSMPTLSPVSQEALATLSPLVTPSSAPSFSNSTSDASRQAGSIFIHLFVGVISLLLWVECYLC